MREKLIKLLDDFSAPVMLMDTKLMDWNIPTQQLREAMADYLIAKGVTIPVRCKECKHMNVVGVGYRWCKAWERIQTMGDDGFCCFGERKDNET